jgi:RNA polymerase sigma-70 factor, ECF subfamily
MTTERRPRRDAGALYRELAPAVLGYLRAQGVSDPEDILGEVFLQVARDLRRVRGDDLAVRKWVFTLARNRVVDAARRRSRRPVISTSSVPDRPGSDPPEPLDPRLAAAIRRLTPDQRDVVLLRFVADLPIEAVARMTRRSTAAVKALQHRALAQLAEAVSSEARPTL